MSHDSNSTLSPVEVLTSVGALAQGHFLLSSGLHSPEYFQCAKLLEDPQIGAVIAGKIAEQCKGWNVQTVLSPAMGAVLIGYELSRALGCRNIFCERPTGIFELRRGFALAPGERVLMAENVITTGLSVNEAADLARSFGAIVVGYAAIVDRSGGKFKPLEPIAAYLTAEAVTYKPEECPMCSRQMPISKPGSREIIQPRKT